jgi:NADPH-dependent ferric siderophore reductase
MSTDSSITTLRTHLAVVDRTVQLTPCVRRITFAGEDFTDYRSVAPDDFLYLLLPPPGRTELTVGRDFDWISYYEMPEEERPVGSHYTVRHHRPERGEIDVDFVLHDHPGPASGWAERARPGDPVALWGPRTSYHPPADTDWYLLVADETGLPAAASILESLPAHAHAHVFAEVACEAERQALPASPAIDVTWLHRGGAAPGTTALLSDAVRAFAWPEGEPYVWGGGESRTMTEIRRYVRNDRGLERERVSVVGYWRRTP